MALGDLSARYESNGDPGAVADNPGDAGGASYGAYQFATSAGVPQAFVVWLSGQGYGPAAVLAGAGEPGTAEFNAAWEQVADGDREGFLEQQRRYVELQYYHPAKEGLLGLYYDLTKHAEAVCQVVWSAAVQYGPGYVGELFQAACTQLGYDNLSYVDASNFDADIIRAVYAVRATDEWTDGSPDLRPALRARFAAECADALAML
ncbi:MAG: hypothetical protein P4N41_16670 [Negativicutes bacterium]|nr:hypothetical protein [Negativicutes bacterium]MDR3591289.1 hypothetical protein [Negativicutes bacterium]